MHADGDDRAIQVIPNTGKRAALNHVTANSKGPCCHCGQLTDQVEIHFEAFLCPGNCTVTWWAEYAGTPGCNPGEWWPEEIAGGQG